MKREISVQPRKSALRYFTKKDENMYLCKDLYVSVHDSFTYNSQKLETMLMVINGWINCGISIQWNALAIEKKIL